MSELMKVTFEGCGEEIGLQDFSLDRQLNRVGHFSGVLVVDKELTAQSFPEKVECKLGGVLVFQGELSAMQRLGRLVYEARFSDPSFALRKHSDSFWFKETQLSSVIEAVVEGAGIQCEFHGGFQDVVSGLTFSQKSLFECLQELSESFGFFFFYRPASGKLVFLRSGQSLGNSNVETGEEVQFLEWEDDFERSSDEAEVSYFDAKELQREERKLQSAELFNPIRDFQPDDFSQKSRFRHAAGRRQSEAKSRLGYDASAERIQNVLSARVLARENLHWVSKKLGVEIGAQVSASGKALQKMDEGKYLVSRLRVWGRSVTPLVHYTGIRA